MEGHKGFLNEASVTFTDKADGKDLKKKEKGIGCKHWKQQNFIGLKLMNHHVSHVG